MEYNKLAILMVKDLRGEVSQSRFSHLLGYEHNLVHKWEKSKKTILWSDFLDICTLKKIKIDSILKNVVGQDHLVKDEWSFIHFLIESESLSKLSHSLNLSRDILYNLLNRKTRPKLSIILQLIDYFSWISIDDFIEKVCSYNMLNEIIPNYSLIKKFNSLTIQEPKMALLLSTLNLDMYKKLKKHDEELLSKKLKISIDQVQRYIKVLKDIGIIKLKNEKYIIEKEGGLVSIQNYSEEELYNIDKFWIEQALMYFKEMPPEARAYAKRGFLRLTFDEESLKEVENVTFKYFQSLQDISMSSKQSTEIRVININYFDPLW